MTLEDLLREAATKGMTHLTLYPVHSSDNKTIYWMARSTPSTGHQYVAAAKLDPVEAVTAVLEALPRAKKRAPAKVTVAVTEPIVMDETAENLARVDEAFAAQKENWFKV